MNDLCLHELIEAQVARTPDRIAVVFEGQSLTYRELDRRANQVAVHLRTKGAAPDVLVALFIERSLEMIVGLLGILKSGAAYLPIDPANPTDRIEFILADANVGVVVTQSSLQSRAGDRIALCLDQLRWTGVDTPPDTNARPEHLAYVIYTSGSTGQPKGVCIEHRNIVNYVLGISDRFMLEPGMTYATVSTIAADLGNTVIFPSLATGGTLHVIAQPRLESQALLAEYFDREPIDVLKIVPSHLAALQNGKNPERVMPRRALILGGEASRADWIEQLRAIAPGCQIYNHYGPTEATVGVLTYEVGESVPATESGTLPLGGTLPNTSVLILDESGQPVRGGAIGEIYIGGRGVARGYLNRPDLTAERFRDGFYRTGDRARFLPDGTLEFLGRVDDQIKLFGNRIEPQEIVRALREHAGVRDAHVVAAEDQLIAYVIPAESSQPLWDHKNVCVLPDGSAVAHLNKNETDYIYNEIFVLQAYLHHGITINDGDTILDAGANIGLFTVFASRIARDVRIISFEPNPAAYACLKANAEAWGHAVRCLPFGLSRENKEAEMTFFEGLSLLSGFYADAATEREVVKNYVFNQEPQDDRLEMQIETIIDDRLRAKNITAQVRTLSSVIAEEGIDRIDLLKVNVEKSELDVLHGLNGDDWQKIRQIVIEVDRTQNLEPITALLRGNGYQVIVEQDPLLRNTELCYVYATRGQRVEHTRRAVTFSRNVLTPATLRKHLKEQLPQYMVPSSFVLLEKFPLNANGKIDRAALPSVMSESRPSVTAARTATEKTLATIWSEMLNVPTVGIDDDFFDLGGQSLMAIKVLSRIREVFEVDIALRNLFEQPTVAGLAAVIDAMSSVASPSVAALASHEREEVAF